jgi:hypothetical protein
MQRSGAGWSLAVLLLAASFSVLLWRAMQVMPSVPQNLLHVEAAVVEAAGLPARPLAQRLSDETVWQDHACNPAKPRDSGT